MDEPLRIGHVIHGHVNGYFGRDHYDCARIEAIGADWVVARTFEGHAITAAGSGVVAACAVACTEVSYPHTCGCPEDKD